MTGCVFHYWVCTAAIKWSCIHLVSSGLWFIGALLCAWKITEGLSATVIWQIMYVCEGVGVGVGVYVCVCGGGFVCWELVSLSPDRLFCFNRCLAKSKLRSLSRLSLSLCVI